MNARPFTAIEARNIFLSQIKSIIEFWAHIPNKTPQELCDGVAFSILNIFDGTSGGLPAMDIVLRPSPEDKEYCISSGENWFKAGQVINDCMLHELWYKKEREDDNPERA